jgi:cytosine/adenosine deaminase-related metal-dependent hydrolase
MPQNQPVDSLASPSYVLEGRVVTMNEHFDVLDRGRVYIDRGRIKAVLRSDDPAPEGMENAPLIKTKGTIYPGLIELHNHLCYNALPLWQVPKKYSHRDEWRRHPDYRKLISGPTAVLGSSGGYIEALVRYGEAKCLLAGVTTTQGITLASNAGIRRYYRGIVRNVEQTDDPELPEAATRIADVDARDSAGFLRALERVEKRSLLLHLSEGIGEFARRHFQALQISEDQWAITRALAGIHCCGLQGDDYAVLHTHAGGLIWSPFSNLLLYGDTVDIARAKAEGLLIALGSDWSPSGSKNLLGEIKVARLVSQHVGQQSDPGGSVFSDRELVAMVTINPARILKWDKTLGSLEPGKRADVMVIRGQEEDPYAHLIEAGEEDITFVAINGIPRYGLKKWLRKFSPSLEDWEVGSARRALNLEQATAEPLVGTLSLGAARDKLVEGLHRLPELASLLENPATASGMLGTTLLDAQGSWFIEPDQDGDVSFVDGPQLPFAADGTLTGVFSTVMAAEPLSQILGSLELDPLTIVDDPHYFARLAPQFNLPQYVKEGLAKLNGRQLPTGISVLIDASDPVVEKPLTLREFMDTAGELTLEDRRLIVDQALILLEQSYVHLILKRSMHAVDPLQRLRLLRLRLSETEPEKMGPELDFHREMTEIFTSVRDLHTNYLLPEPYRAYTAYLPFLLEECFDKDGRVQYLVTKVAEGFQHPTFMPGVEVLYWNGTPITQAIATNAQRDAGSNPDARRARGLASLSIRPLIRVLPPDEEWVSITYRAMDGRILEIRHTWQVRRSGLQFIASEELDESQSESTALGFDLELEAINQARQGLFARAARRAERYAKASRRRRLVSAGDGMPTRLPLVFRAKPVQTRHGIFGYVRVFTFNVDNADFFVNEFVRLVEQLPQDGLIVDVRNNGGGLIFAAEQLLQVLTPRPIQPESAQLSATPLMLKLCESNSPDFDCWAPSIRQAVALGTVYSNSFSITPEHAANQTGQRYYGPSILVTDALSYSATDMFAAGFQDHAIGPVLGVGNNTGAGGGNVWTHDLLNRFLTRGAHNPLQTLPGRTGMRVALRRTLRVGPNAGMPLEDLGVKPDCEYRMSKRDVLEKNDDLMEFATGILAQLPRYRLTAVLGERSQNRLSLNLETQNLDRVDVFINSRPADSFNVQDGVNRFSLGIVGSGAIIELVGLKRGDLVARRRLTI